MSEECKTNFRILPEIYTREIAKHFQLELQLGQTTQWGIGKYRMNEPNSCTHWLTCVSIGDKRYIPNQCFKTRKEAEEYCHLMGNVFPRICQELFGTGTEKFSSN